MNFIEALVVAMEQTKETDDEEAGGIFLRSNAGIEFIFLPNKFTQTNHAPVLYEPDEDDYVKKILPKLTNGLKLHASFHTHPKFSVNPSILDLRVLFQNFKINVIYGPSVGQLAIYTWTNDATRLQSAIINL